MNNHWRGGERKVILIVQGYGQMYAARYLQTGLPAAPAAPTNTTTDAAPAAPTSLVAAALSSSQIVLQWTNSPSIQTGISIERCSGPCKSYSEIASVAGSAASFTDGALRPHTGYSYRVRAYDGAGWSSYSATVTAKTLR